MATKVGRKKMTSCRVCVFRQSRKTSGLPAREQTHKDKEKNLNDDGVADAQHADAGEPEGAAVGWPVRTFDAGPGDIVAHDEQDDVAKAEEVAQPAQLAVEGERAEGATLLASQLALSTGTARSWSMVGRQAKIEVDGEAEGDADDVQGEKDKHALGITRLWDRVRVAQGRGQGEDNDASDNLESSRGVSRRLGSGKKIVPRKKKKEWVPHLRKTDEQLEDKDPLPAPRQTAEAFPCRSNQVSSDCDSFVATRSLNGLLYASSPCRGAVGCDRRPSDGVLIIGVVSAR